MKKLFLILGLFVALSNSIQASDSLLKPKVDKQGSIYTIQDEHYFSYIKDGDLVLTGSLTFLVRHPRSGHHIVKGLWQDFRIKSNVDVAPGKAKELIGEYFYNEAEDFACKWLFKEERRAKALEYLVERSRQARAKEKLSEDAPLGVKGLESY